MAEAAGRSGSVGAAPQLLAMLKSDSSQQVRLAALEALRLSKGGSADELMRIAFADKSPDGAARGDCDPADAAALGGGQDAAAGDAVRAADRPPRSRACSKCSAR